jgi:beta-galactosidase
VGLREVIVANKQLLVNGKPVLIRGVNRHEHTADKGKTVSEASMLTDVLLMKRYNFNAVRTCHYPNHSRW